MMQPAPHLSEEDLILLYYGENGAASSAREHIAGCSECSRRAEALAETLDRFTNWPEAEPDQYFDERLWRKIAARIPEKRTWAHWTWLPHFRTLAIAAALAAMVVTAFVAGRLTSRPAAPITAGLSPEARDRVLEISLADHLDRAEILLTNLENGIPPDRAHAADLVSEGRLLRSALANSAEPGAIALVDDVERVLVEAANEPENAAASDLELLRRRIEEGSLVFKIRIIKSNLGIRGQRT